jgi:hypothetical protein
MPRPKRQREQSLSPEELQSLDETQWNPAFNSMYHLYSYPHDAHYEAEAEIPGQKPLLCCWFHPEAWKDKPQVDTGPPLAAASEKVPDPPTLAVLYEFIQAENTALKL